MTRKAILTILSVFLFTASLIAQNDTLVGSLRKHVTILASDSLGGRAFGFPENKLAIDYITKQYGMEAERWT